jgi:hypothetical protein
MKYAVLDQSTKTIIETFVIDAKRQALLVRIIAKAASLNRAAGWLRFQVLPISGPAAESY